MPDLVVLGAAYGPAVVTEQVRAMVAGDTLTLTAGNAAFGDPWPRHPKSLVVVYRYGDQAPRVAVAAERDSITLTRGAQTAAWAPTPPGELTVYGAAWGLDDVTATARGRIAGGALTVTADNATFGDGWHRVTKTLVVVYSVDGAPVTRVVQENGAMTTAPLRILGASYGLSDYTRAIADRVDALGELHLANVGTGLPDPWFGHKKSLVVTYRYGGEQPRTVIVPDDQGLQVTYAPGPPAAPPAAAPDALRILGAAYGLADVTADVAGKVRDGRLELQASNTTFGDRWPGVQKTFTVVYQYGGGAPRVRSWLEEQPVLLLPSGNYAVQLAEGSYLAGGDMAGVYHFAGGELTLEAWVRTEGAGPIFSFLSYAVMQFMYESVALAAAADGSIAFSLAAVSDITSPDPRNVVTATAATGPTRLLDGEWHHVAAVRAAGAPAIYLDGIPLPLAVSGSRPGVLSPDWVMVVSIGGGAWGPLAGTTLTGEIDEVRIWSVARTPAQVAGGMHHGPPASAPGLVGLWSFHDGSLADASPTGLPLVGPVAFVPSEVDIEPEGAPYLVTQTLLMQDYAPDPAHPGELVEITGYRVVVAALDADGTPTQATLAVYAADAAAPATVHFMDGTTATITDQVPVSRATNASGEVTFVIDALRPAGAPAANPLLCPVVKLHASFMAPAERLVVSPDRHAHAELAALTADQLTGAAPLPSGATAQLVPPASYAAAQAVTQAVRSVMGGAVDFGVQPHPTATASRKRQGAPEPPLPRPYAPAAGSTQTPAEPYDRSSNATATHFLAADQAVSRVVAAGSLAADPATPHWELELSGLGSGTASFTPLTPQERGERIAALASVAPEDPLAALLAHSDAATASEVVFEGAAGGIQKRSGGSDFWGSLMHAARVVLTVAEVTIRETGETVRVLVAHAIDAAGDAVNLAIRTVEQAVHFVATLLERLGVAISALLHGLKALWDWDAILGTQRVVAAVLAQLPATAKSALDAMQGRADAALEGVQRSIATHFDDWIAALGGGSINSRTEPVRNQPPQGVQSRYLSTLFADNASAATDAANTALALDPALSGRLGQEWGRHVTAAGLDPLRTGLSDPALGALFASPAALLSGALARLLELLKDVAVGVVGLVKQGVDALFGLLREAIDHVFTLCTTRIVIPYLTPLCERVVLKGDLTLLNLVALLAAIPMNVVHRAATGGTDPVFSEQELAAVRDPAWSGYARAGAWVQHAAGGQAPAGGGRAKRQAAAASTTPTTFDKVAWGMGFAYAGATLLWGVCCYLEDTGVESRVVVLGKLVTQGITIVAGHPVWTLGDDTPAAILGITLAIYGGGLLAFGSNLIAAGTSQAEKWWNENVDPIFTGAYGVLQLCGYIAISILEVTARQPWLKVGMDFATGIGESLEWIPQLLKPIARYCVADPVRRTALTKVVLPRAEFVGYAIVFDLTLAATVASMAEGLGVAS
ncbi:MAG: LamG-like jellyroll fold domain-containing protein [Longimicrobiaceae bacterium]